jgi:hypothetical protein
VKRILVPSATLLWGLQFAVLNAALALILVDLFGGRTAGTLPSRWRATIDRRKPGSWESGGGAQASGSAARLLPGGGSVDELRASLAASRMAR